MTKIIKNKGLQVGQEEVSCYHHLAVKSNVIVWLMAIYGMKINFFYGSR